jgi:hypothetical protein
MLRLAGIVLFSSGLVASSGPLNPNPFHPWHGTDRSVHAQALPRSSSNWAAMLVQGGFLLATGLGLRYWKRRSPVPDRQ